MQITFDQPSEGTVASSETALAVSNTSTGAALTGTSSRGDGVLGTVSSGSLDGSGVHGIAGGQSAAVWGENGSRPSNFDADDPRYSADVRGSNWSTGGTNVAVAGVYAESPTGYGLFALGGVAGVQAVGTDGYGLYAAGTPDAIFGQGDRNGVHGQTSSPNDSGIWGENTGPPPSGTNQSYGVTGTSVNGDGIFGRGAKNGVHGQTASPNDSGIWGENTGPPPSGTNQSYGVTGTSVNGDGIFGQGARNGVHGQTASPDDSGIWGENTGPPPSGTNQSYGVTGTSVNGDGIFGQGARNGVHGQSTSANDSGVWGENTNGGVGVAGSSSGLAGEFTGNVLVTGSLTVTQDASVAGTLTTHDVVLSNMDCAEDFDIADIDGAEPGTVMVLDDTGNLCPNEVEYDKRVVGVISGAGLYRPGITLGRVQSSMIRRPIALLGRVYCKVDGDCGPIEVGDLLTTSATRGHAMKASNAAKGFGSIIGKAMQRLPSGRGLIPILVALQ